MLPVRTIRQSRSYRTSDRFQSSTSVLLHMKRTVRALTVGVVPSPINQASRMLNNFAASNFFVPSFGCLQSGKGHFLWRAINLARSCTSTYNLHLYSLQLNSHDDQQNGSPKYGFYKSLYRLDLLGSVSFESLPQ